MKPETQHRPQDCGAEENMVIYIAGTEKILEMLFDLWIGKRYSY
jgi:hypothetical protein